MTLTVNRRSSYRTEEAVRGIGYSHPHFPFHSASEKKAHDLTPRRGNSSPSRAMPGSSAADHSVTVVPDGNLLQALLSQRLANASSDAANESDRAIAPWGSG